MKNKILKAINEGILKVLSTDIEDQDIDFDQSDIDSQYNTYEYYLKNLFKSTNKKTQCNYIYDIFKCYASTHRTYKIKSFDELTQILDVFTKILQTEVLYLKNDKYMPSYSGIFDWLDVSDIMTLTLLDKDFNTYHWQTSKYNRIFIKIVIPELNISENNAIIIPMWINKLEELPIISYRHDNIYKHTEQNELTNDLDGYKNTQLLKTCIRKQIKNKQMKNISPALYYTDNIKNTDYILNDMDNTKIKAYIPSMGQMLIIDKLLPLINVIQKKSGYSPIGTGREKYYFKCWTSTEYKNGIYFFSGGSWNIEYQTIAKYPIFPLFKIL